MSVYPEDGGVIISKNTKTSLQMSLCFLIITIEILW